MANTERIEDIISEKAFKQMEKLLSDLGIAQQKFVDTAKAAEELNNAVAKSKSFKDLTDNTKKLSEATADVTTAQEKFIKVSEKTAKAEDQLVKVTKERIAATVQDKKSLDQIAGTLEQNIKLQVRLKAELKEVRDQQKALTKEVALSQKSKQALASKTAELATKEAQLKAAIQQTNLDIRRTVKEQNAASGSSDQLAVRLDRLRAAYRSLSAEERENEKIGGRLLQQITELDEKVKQLDGRQGVHNRHVGDYGRALDNLNQKLSALKTQYRQLSTAEQRNMQVGGVLLGQIRTTELAIKRLNTTMISHNAVMGGFRGTLSALVPTLRSLMSAFGFVGGIFLFAQVIRDAGRTVAGFQKQNAILAGVLDTTRDNIGALTDDAIRLGRTTAKSASEVALLQTEYAKLGFSQREILDLTEGTINGSIALNAKLDETAALVGAMVRTFDDLKTNDAARILDQMTAAANLSALGFKELQTALPIVSGAANAAGISFEELLSLLGKLSDAGIDASMSATALRNIFIESASQGLKYDKILERIAGSSDKLTASTNEFGKRAAVSGTILAGQLSTLDEFKQKLEESGGTAERLANEQLNTLDGAWTLVKSAWEGIVLSVEAGDGVINRLLMKTLRGLATLLNNTAREIEVLKEGALQISAAFAGAGKVLDAFTGMLKNMLNAMRSFGDIEIDFLNPGKMAASIGNAFNSVRNAATQNLDAIRKAYREGYDSVIEEARKGNAKVAEETGGTDPNSPVLPVTPTLTEEQRKAREKAARKAAEAAINLQKSQVARQAELAKRVVENEKASFDERQKNLEAYLKRQQELIELEGKKQLLGADLLADDRTRIEEETQARIADLKVQGAELAKEIIKDQLDEEDRLRAEAQNRLLSNIETRRAEELAILARKRQQGEIQEEEYQRRKLDIEYQYSQEYVAAEIKAAQTIIDLYKSRGLSTADAEKTLAALKVKYSQEVTDKQISDLERLEEREQLVAERRRELSREVFDLGLSLFTSNIDREKNRLAGQLEQIEVRKQHEIEAANASAATEEEKANRIRIAEATAQIEREKIERKQRQMAVEKAKFDRLAQVAGIVGNTARGVTSALAMFPPNIPLSILVGAIGAAQLGQVLATPLPKYAQGVESSPEGWAWVSERGPEGRIEPDGSVSMTPSGGPALTYLARGTKIIPHEEMRRMASSSITLPAATSTGGHALDTRPLIDAQERSTKKMVKALTGRAESKTVVTAGGVRYFVRKGGSWKEYVGQLN